MQPSDNPYHNTRPEHNQYNTWGWYMSYRIGDNSDV